MTTLVTGATGRVGWHVARLLAERGERVRAAVRSAAPATAPWHETIPFSYTDPATWPAAHAGVDRMFVVRPPRLSDMRRDMLPALEAAKAAGVGHMVLLSLQGADSNPFVPHRTLEQWLQTSGPAWTFVRAAFFMQNLSTTHAAEIRDTGTLTLPAGHGRTSFVDVRDVASVAAVALTEDGHAGRAYTPTGATAHTYDEVAATLSLELARRIAYQPVGPVRYLRHARNLGVDTGMALVTTALYTACRFGMAAGITDDVYTVTGCPPIDLVTFAHDERQAWLPHRDQATTRRAVDRRGPS